MNDSVWFGYVMGLVTAIALTYIDRWWSRSKKGNSDD